MRIIVRDSAVRLLALAGHNSVRDNSDNTYTLQIPPVSEASTPLPPSFVSLSIEFQHFPFYTGNYSHPNDFSLGLLKHLATIGDPLFIRIGGSTEDRVYYDASFPEPIVSYFDFWWESNPYNGTMGPSFFDGVGLLPSDFRYVFGVNEGGFNNSQGVHDPETTLSNIVNQTREAYKIIGDQLWAIETGNEMSGFNFSYQGVWYRNPTEDWTLADFVAENFNVTYDALQGPILPGRPHMDQSRNPLWRAGDLSGFKPGWTFEDTWELGQNAWRRLREYSVHIYPATLCSQSAGAKVTIENTMLNHGLTAATLEPNRARAAYTAEQGVEFVIGEGNSVSCSGKPGVSDSYSAALWAFDWAMYSASIGIKRMYYHQGPGFPYAAIWPTTINGTEPSVRGSYYGYILASIAVGSTKKGTSGKRVATILNETSVSAYALYSSPTWQPSRWYTGASHDTAADLTKDKWHLTDLAFLNLRPFNQTSPQNSRGNLSFHIGSEWNGAKITRLTAPGADTLPVTHGEAPYLESHDEEGPISVGCISYESGRAKWVDGCSKEFVAHGVVTVGDSEAVLISRLQ
ncbi:hypothetical protein F5884DRAFT_2471 [Xylogone sp. PMI_703]|nr:hypothetical protein F5884DRAFT_2471 [Xylogone sp. PMI_703]